ncbi:MAG: chitosanase [Blastocatellia bacterium]
MKQHAFSTFDKMKALAIVNIFETSKPFGSYSSLAVLDDGAGISFGISQFTHRSGSLLAVVGEYLERGGAVGRKVIEERLPLLQKTTKAAIESLAADTRFRKAIQAAAITAEMRAAQEQVAFEKYLRPAVEACVGSGFLLPLSLAVVYDSITHGSWERFRDSVNATLDEKAWITEYVRKRDAWLRSVPRLKATRYRTRFFLSQIALGRWNLDLPLDVHGTRLSDNDLRIRERTAETSAFLKGSMVEPNRTSTKTTKDTIPPKTPPEPAKTPQAQPSANAENDDRCLDEIEERVNAAAQKYDRVEGVVNTVLNRTDSAKSLWTTVAGTLWQAGWAIAGFAAGLPREIWFVVAIVAAALMFAYLYRQIALGKIREANSNTKSLETDLSVNYQKNI